MKEITASQLRKFSFLELLELALQSTKVVVTWQGKRKLVFGLYEKKNDNLQSVSD